MLNVVGDLGDGAVAVARRVLDLGADLGTRLAEPLHRDRRKQPHSSARGTMRQLRVAVGVTGAASDVLGADAACPAVDVHPMRTRLGAVAGSRPDRHVVRADMAIRAAGVREDLVDLAPHRQARVLSQGRRGHQEHGNHIADHFARAPQTNSMCLFSGSSRMRLPVAAKMALARAGAAGGTLGSPMPRTSLVLVSARTSISGVW